MTKYIHRHLKLFYMVIKQERDFFNTIFFSDQKINIFYYI